MIQSHSFLSGEGRKEHLGRESVSWLEVLGSGAYTGLLMEEIATGSTLALRLTSPMEALKERYCGALGSRHDEVNNM